MVVSQLFSNPLGLVALSILPRDIASGDVSRVRLLLRKIFKLIVPVAIVGNFINTAVPVFFPGIFTSSIVQLCVHKVTLQSGISLTLICVEMMLDGVSEYSSEQAA